MKGLIKYSVIAIVAGVPLVFLQSCEDFLNPVQEINITEEQLFDDWYEYRSVEMGLYALQQDLVEQLVILGELRGDLLTVTNNADADMIEINNFSISRTNKYASPTKFFKLISATNNFIRILKSEHPEILDPESPVTNYDRLYGEALTMRAWAYFNAVRIYGKVPFIHESLVTMDEVDAFINSPGTYIDSIYIEFATDGYYNDTVFNHPVELERNYYDQNLVIDVFTDQLENDLKAVGVNHYIDNNDISWEVTVWNTYALDALLGQMYLTQGDMKKAAFYFERIIYNSSDNLRYHLDNSFSDGSWMNIFENIDSREHIYTIWFNKANFQQNDLQSIFVNNYMLKPSWPAIYNWETVWRFQVIDEDLVNPQNTEMIFAGIPSDFYRGYGSSYLYVKNGLPLSGNKYMEMLNLRANEDMRGSLAIMEDVDTLAYKYAIGKGHFDKDANFSVFRAASIHLYLAEVYTFWAFDQNGLIRTNTNMAKSIVNDGSNYDISVTRDEMGVRGRVGLGSTADGIKIANFVYTHDPYTNEIIGFENLTGNLPAKQKYFEHELMQERARELAFEGERFYDLIRVAKRRGDPSYLAKLVSAKYPPEKRDQMYNLLLNEENWYLKYFE